MKNIMDLNQAEVAVTTQHLIDTRQEKDSLLQMSDFGDMGEFLCTLSLIHILLQQTTKEKYSIETLRAWNVSYDNEHGLTQKAVDMANSYVCLLYTTRCV